MRTSRSRWGVDDLGDHDEYHGVIVAENFR
jgi:hypothetical protein